MTDEQDPRLLALFESAAVVAEDDAFVTRVMADIDGAWRRTVIGWIVAGLLFTPLVWWLARPIMDVFIVVGELLPDSLFTIEQEWFAQLLAPVNGVAGIAGLLFLVVWTLYRKLVH